MISDNAETDDPLNKRARHLIRNGIVSTIPYKAVS